MKRFSIFLACFSLSLGLIAQESPIRIKTSTSKKGEENNLIFDADNRSYAKTTIMLDVGVQGGSRYRLASEQVPLVKTVPRGRSRILTLFGIQSPPAYNLLYVEGCLDVEPEKLTYLLPLAAGKATTAYHLYNLGARYFGKDEPKDWASYAFTATLGDTIFAARGGVVLKVEEGKKQVSSEQNFSYNRGINYLVVEHDDCTRGRYEMFAQNEVFPEPGKEIQTGDPLGTIAEGSGFSAGTHIRFSVYYLELSRGIVINYRRGITKLISPFVKPDFHLEGSKVKVEDQAEYTVEHPQEVIFQEMRKKEIKKWKRLHGGK